MSPAVASADPHCPTFDSPPTEEALDTARLRAMGEFEESLRVAEICHRIEPRAATAFNLAQSYRWAGRFWEALPFYWEVLQKPDPRTPPVPAVVLQEASTQAENLVRKFVRVTVRPVRRGLPVDTSVTVTARDFDGAVVQRGAEWVVRPGRYDVSADVPGQNARHVVRARFAAGDIREITIDVASSAPLLTQESWSAGRRAIGIRADFEFQPDEKRSSFLIPATLELTAHSEIALGATYTYVRSDTGAVGTHWGLSVGYGLYAPVLIGSGGVEIRAGAVAEANWVDVPGRHWEPRLLASLDLACLRFYAGAAYQPTLLAPTEWHVTAIVAFGYYFPFF